MKHLSQTLPVVVLLSLAVFVATGARAATAPFRLLVVEAARDTTAGFRAQELPELGRRALTWPDGLITLPDTAGWLEHGERGLAFRLAGDPFAALGSQGRFAGESGSYEIDTPLFLSDGAVTAFLAKGRLEIEDDRIVYRAPGHRRDQRGDLLLLGGIILATAVLLRAARQRTRRS